MSVRFLPEVAGFLFQVLARGLRAYHSGVVATLAAASFGAFAAASFRFGAKGFELCIGGQTSEAASCCLSQNKGASIDLEGAPEAMI